MVEYDRTAYTFNVGHLIVFNVSDFQVKQQYDNINTVYAIQQQLAC